MEHERFFSSGCKAYGKAPSRRHPFKRHGKMARIGMAMVERIYQQFNRRKAAERMTLQCPNAFGIGEHTIHKTQRFVTTFCNLRNRKIIDVVPGGSEKEMVAFLSRLQGRKRGKVVCIDPTSPYWRLIRRWFSTARIVADRFHVVHTIQNYFMALLASWLHPFLNDVDSLLCCKQSSLK